MDVCSDTSAILDCKRQLFGALVDSGLEILTERITRGSAKTLPQYVGLGMVVEYILYQPQTHTSALHARMHTCIHT